MRFPALNHVVQYSTYEYVACFLCQYTVYPGKEVRDVQCILYIYIQYTTANTVLIEGLGKGFSLLNRSKRNPGFFLPASPVNEFHAGK